MKVIMIAASTICGRISPSVTGSSFDRQRLENARLDTAAGLIGAGTFRKDNPEMRGPGGVILGNRLRAIISLSGNIPLEGKKLFNQGPKPIIFTGANQTDNLEKHLGKNAEIVTVPVAPHGLLISAAIDELKRRGAETVLIEGGARLNYACLKEGLVDEILLTITPFLSGDSGALSLAEGLGSLGNPFLAFELIESEAIVTGEIFCRYRIKR